jgi:hypothetical protein
LILEKIGKGEIMSDEQNLARPFDAEHYHDFIYYKVGAHNLLYAWLGGSWVRKSYETGMTYDILSTPMSGVTPRGRVTMSRKDANYLNREGKVNRKLKVGDK